MASGYKAYADLLPLMQAQGYVTTEEACKLTQRAPSGSTNALFIKRGVKHVRAGRLYFWRKDDLAHVPPPKVVKSESVKEKEVNSVNALQKKLRDLEVRVAVLESYVEGKPNAGKADTAEVFTLAPPGASLS